ncbi:hypothetical protein LMG19282_05400 [Cupriavidus campinensis]|nr:hypothetical protein LMG19282_05400 [Cupriavidus campinensis]
MRLGGAHAAQVEARHLGHQPAGLLHQALGRRAGLLHQCRVLLRHRFHLGNRQADLLDAGGLLLAGRADLAHDVGHAAHGANDIVHGLAGHFHLLGAVLYLTHRAVDQFADLLGRRRRALRQAAHLGRHHAEAPALLAGTGRFHGRVQREDVGLEGDALDHADDLGHARGGLRDTVHRVHHAAHHPATFRGHIRGVDRQLVGLAGILGVLAHGGGQLFHRGGSLLERGRLLLGPLGQVGIADGNLARRRVDRSGGLLDAAHQHAKLAEGTFHRAEHAAHLVLGAHGNGMAQAALG